MSSAGGLNATVGVRPCKWLSLVHQIRRMKSAVERVAGAMMVAVIYFVVTVLAAWTTDWYRRVLGKLYLKFEMTTRPVICPIIKDACVQSFNLISVFFIISENSPFSPLFGDCHKNTAKPAKTAALLWVVYENPTTVGSELFLLRPIKHSMWTAILQVFYNCTESFCTCTLIVQYVTCHSSTSANIRYFLAVPYCSKLPKGRPYHTLPLNMLQNWHYFDFMLIKSRLSRL